MITSIRPLAVTRDGLSYFLPIPDTSEPPAGLHRVPCDTASTWCDDRRELDALDAPRFRPPLILGEPLARLATWVTREIGAQPEPQRKTWSLRRSPPAAHVLRWYASLASAMTPDVAFAAISPRLCAFGFTHVDVHDAIAYVREHGSVIDVAAISAQLEADHHASLVAAREREDQARAEAEEVNRIANTPIKKTLEDLGLYRVRVPMVIDALAIGAGTHLVQSNWPHNRVERPITFPGGTIDATSDVLEFLPGELPHAMAGNFFCAHVERTVADVRKTEIAKDGPIAESELHDSDTEDGAARLAAAWDAIRKYRVADLRARAEMLVRSFGVALEGAYESLRADLHADHERLNAQRLASYVSGARNGRVIYEAEETVDMGGVIRDVSAEEFTRHLGNPDRHIPGRLETRKVQRWTTPGSKDDPFRPKALPFTGPSDVDIAATCEAALETATFCSRGEFFDADAVAANMASAAREPEPNALDAWAAVFLAVAGTRGRVAGAEFKTALTEAGLAPARWLPKDHSRLVTIANSLGWMAGSVRAELKDGSKSTPVQGFSRRELVPMPGAMAVTS